MEGQNAEAMPAGSILQPKLIANCGLLGNGQKWRKESIRK